MAQQEILEKFEQYQAMLKKQGNYQEAVALMSWDLQTYAPKGAVEGRSEVVGMLAAEAFKLSVSPEFEAMITDLLEAETFSRLTFQQQRSVQKSKETLDRFKKVPPEEYEAYQVLVAKAQAVWEQAKENRDFQSFLPYLEKIVVFSRKFADWIGYEGHPYNALLNMYEPNMTVAVLDQIFETIKEKTVPLLAKIKASQVKIDNGIFQKHFDFKKQEELSLEILNEMGYDFNRGRLDQSVHPFTIGINLGDVRITTHYDPDFLSNAFFSAIHEGGHGIYEQNISEELKHTSLDAGASMGIHESQSRFWENMVGRSRSFWTYFEPKIRAAFPELFEGMTLETIYQAINEVKPSLIRIQADELTYNLHIIVRYELEKALIEGTIQPAELPRLWNEKIEAYLGVRPEHDGEGVLQDVHWSGGMLGYFPSYSLGNIYAAQLYTAMKKALPDYEARIAQGDFSQILAWLKENIHEPGSLYKPIELIERVTGEGIDPAYYVAYLEEKYGEIYQLK